MTQRCAEKESRQERCRIVFLKQTCCSSVLCRSFSELYQKAIKDAECKPGEDQSGEAWVLDEREEEEGEEEEGEAAVAEEEKEEEKLRRGGVSEAVIMAEDEEGEGQPCDRGQSERSHGSLLTPPSLPLLRATSLQDQPANQSQEGSAPPQLTRSCSLERRPSFRDACDGWVPLLLLLRCMSFMKA